MIGSSIIKIRKSKNISQTELAKKSGITQSHLSLIENNKKKPSLRLLQSVSESLQVPLAIMFWFTLDDSQVNENKMKDKKNKKYKF